jgi:hypothetical protein
MNSAMLEKWLDPKGVFIVVVLLFFLVGFGAVSDAVAATMLAMWLTIVTARYVYAEADRVPRAGRVALVGGTAALMLVPLLATLVPGPELLDAQLPEGGHVEIPSDVEGPVRVMVHGDIAGSGQASVKFRLRGLGAPVSGKLERKIGRARVGRRRVSEAQLHNTQLLSGTVGPKHDLTMEMARGAIAGPLRVVLFREWWPQRHELILGGLMLLATLFLALRKRTAANLVPVVVAVTAFGVFAYRWITPDLAFRPEVGALVVAALVGGVAYVPWRRAVA